MIGGRTVDEPGIRLQKMIAAAGIASRRAAERLITDGRVTVNGRTVRELGTRADPERDDIRVDGRRVARAARRRYLLVHKPAGYVTTRSDPQHRPTVLDLIPDVREYVYPVGRLDYDSEGLLLLTNDGPLAAILTHPRHGMPRVYEAVVRGVPTPAELQRLAAGVTLDGRRTAPAEVRLLPRGGTDRASTADARVRLVLHEGRNRQVRRMFDAIGHPVRRLRRTRQGPLALGRLKPGQARDLTPAEVQTLQHAARQAATGARRRPAGRGPQRSRAAAASTDGDRAGR